MNFTNDPIADAVEKEMKALKAKGAELSNTNTYNRVFEAFYKLHQELQNLKAIYGTPVGEPVTIGIASPVLETANLWKGLPEVFEGTIYMHRKSGLVEPAIRSYWGDCFELIRKDHEFASNNIGSTVKVKAVKEYYFTVELVS